MLTEKSAAIVRATLPAVGEAVEEITSVFYRRMFDAHPELLRDLFNRGNQANGAQSKALAGAFAAFAAMLVEHPDERPDAMLRRIAHKHASLGIVPDHYPIVETYLLGAVAQVLGDAVTEEVATAWREVYRVMADTLIAMEAELYAEAGVEVGDVWRTWRVDRRIEETSDVVTLALRPTDGSVPRFRPGQYVSVRVPLPDGARQIRQYSLSWAPNGADLSISVKRVASLDEAPEGEVSSWLHANAREGDVLEVSIPFGDIALEDEDAPLLLASAGIGCTPIMSMLSHLESTGSVRPVIAVHGDRSETTHAFREDVQSIATKLPDACVHVWYERPEGEWPPERIGRVDLSGLDIPAHTRAYLCGPLPFMRTVRSQLLERGVPASQIHYEVFGPDMWLGSGT